MDGARKYVGLLLLSGIYRSRDEAMASLWSEESISFRTMHQRREAVASSNNNK